MAFLRLIRFKNLLIIVLLQLLLRYVLLLPMLAHYGLEPALSHLRFALLVLTTVFLAASGYVINDYFDIKTDLINRPSRVVAGQVYPRRTVLLWHVLFTFLGVFMGLFLAYISRKENYALMFILVPALLWYYSTTLKKQMLIGNLVISFMTAIVPYFVVSLEFAVLARVHGEAILDTEACSMAWFWTTGFAFFAFASNLGREIIKDLEDVKGDAEAGCRTLPIEMGEPATRRLVAILHAALLLALWIVYAMVPQLRSSPLAFVYFLVLLTLPFLWLMFKVLKARSRIDYHKASQWSKLIMLLGILFVFVVRSFFPL